MSQQFTRFYKNSITYHASIKHLYVKNSLPCESGFERAATMCVCTIIADFEAKLKLYFAVSYFDNLLLQILQGCHSISFSKLRLFTDFSLTFDRFPDGFGRSILAIVIHRQLENFVQIFLHSDLIFKEKSQTIKTRK